MLQTGAKSNAVGGEDEMSVISNFDGDMSYFDPDSRADFRDLQADNDNEEEEDVDSDHKETDEQYLLVLLVLVWKLR